jgi:hypothetical protein
MSSGLIIMAYFAPDRLTRGLTASILTLYAAMTTFIFLSVRSDLQSADVVFKEATLLSESYGVMNDVLVQRTSAVAESAIGGAAMLLFFVGLYLGTNGYLIYVSITNRKKSSGEGGT